MEVHEAGQEARKNKEWALAEYWDGVLIERLASLTLLLSNERAGDSGTASGADD
jgi:hypothetical protein